MAYLSPCLTEKEVYPRHDTTGPWRPMETSVPVVNAVFKKESLDDFLFYGNLAMCFSLKDMPINETERITFLTAANDIINYKELTQKTKLGQEEIIVRIPRIVLQKVIRAIQGKDEFRDAFYQFDLSITMTDYIEKFMPLHLKNQ